MLKTSEANGIALMFGFSCITLTSLTFLNIMNETASLAAPEINETNKITFMKLI